MKEQKPLNVYTIYDKVAVDSCPPFTAKNDGVALRQFHQLVASNKAALEEYELYLIGYYESETMVLVTTEKPTQIRTTMKTEVADE